jgi:hypothetical protein
VAILLPTSSIVCMPLEIALNFKKIVLGKVSARTNSVEAAMSRLGMTRILV